MGPHAFAAEFAHCLAFLTRIPLPAALPFELPPLNHAMRQFPLIGMLIGCVTGIAVCLCLALHIPAPVAATIGIAAAAVLTGGLHEDGLADMADGFGGGPDKDQKLRIMRDSRIGTYGVLALVFAVLLKIQALAVLTTQQAWLMVASLTVIGALSRALMVWLMRTSDPARSGGLAAAAGRPSQAAMNYALSLGIVPAFLMFWMASGLLASLVILAAGFAFAMGIRGLAMRQIGGHTGDVCGAVQMISETAMLIAASSMLG